MYNETRLDNGLRILTQEMPHTYSVSSALYFVVGSRYESDQAAGISHLIEHMLFKGTQRRPTSREVAEAIEEVGGVMNAGTERELTSYWAKVTTDYRDLALDLLADIVRHSKFTPEDLEKERKVIVEEIHMANDVPSELVHVLIDQLVFPDHPLGRDIAGTAASVSSLDHGDVLQFYRQHYVPNQFVISVAGAISHVDIIEQCKRYFGDWEPGPAIPYEPAPERALRRRRTALQIKETEQTHLCISAPALPRQHPDRRAQDVLNLVLGGSMSSRLFMEIREERALAYDVHSFVEHYSDTGVLVIYAGTDPEQTESCASAILEELARLRDEPLPAAELRKAKAYFKGRLLLGLEDSGSIASWLGSQEALTGRILSPEQVTAQLEAVQVDDIQRVARQQLDSSYLQLAVVGPQQDEGRLQQLLKGDS